jgi:uncharacterized protein (TIGR03790 family)
MNWLTGIVNRKPPRGRCAEHATSGRCCRRDPERVLPLRPRAVVWWRFLWLATAAWAAPCCLPQIERGNEVVVLYNRRVSPDSRLVAEHYAQRRKVPPNQVIGLELPDTENMTRAQFREQLQKPLLRELEQRQLLTFRNELAPATKEKPGEFLRLPVHAQFRYLVLCYGVPLRVLADPALKEHDTDKLIEPLRRNEASVDSELALLPRSENRMMLTGLIMNPFHGVTNAALLTPLNGLLMVSRLDGPTMDIARRLVDRALEAETNGLWGRAYFDSRGITNGSYKIGDEWIRAAWQVARRQGFDCHLDEKPETLPASFPLAQAALYAGWYDGNASGPFARPTVEFMPGAIAYHLHSFSASTLRSTTLAWVGPLLAKGAAATLGTVNEPYLEATPDVGVLFSRLLAYRFTFGEAAYAAERALSWQTTVVGDPLYRPMGNDPKLLHERLEQQRSPLLAWSHLRVVNLNLVTDLGPDVLIAYLEGQPLTAQSAVLEQKLAELYLLIGKVAECFEHYKKALNLDPSPQQKVNLELTLARLYSNVDRDVAALELYTKFLQERPDYPDRLSLCQKALPLARKLNQTNLLDRFEREINRLSPPKPAATNSPAARPSS